MTSLRFGHVLMPAASMGEINPLAGIANAGDLHAQVELSGPITEEEGKYFGYGKVYSVLPYMMQDGYDRNKRPRAFEAAILENDYLRAIFLPEVGGLLWSLFDKEKGRELLYCNPVFQPGNLALRNAWMSGGVEWNIGWTGHHPYTMSTLFTAAFNLPDGTPVLRMYEFERVRRAAYRIDAYLPDGSRYLFVRPQINNTQDETVPMYWWSNMAVRETPDVRVVTPADTAFAYKYGGGIEKIPVPVYEGVDGSYVVNFPRAFDFFFNVPKERQKFIATIDKNGDGVVQTSTRRLQGRKLFMWGMNQGGRHWNEYLSLPNYNFLETQSGLAHTQAECLPMPALKEWSWLEAYGAIKADPEKVHGGPDGWKVAYEHVDQVLQNSMPQDQIDAEFEKINAHLNGVRPKLTLRGGGWGRLEELRLEKEGKAFACGGLVFDDCSLTDEQAPWLALLNTGALPEADPNQAPVSYQIQPEWQAMLEKAAVNGSDNWNAWMHLGVMRFYHGDRDGAMDAYRRSLALAPSAWVYRNLAAIAKLDKDDERAADYYMKALSLRPDQRALCIEATELLCSLRPAFCYEAIQRMPGAIRALGRIRYHEAKAAVNCGKLAEAERMLRGPFELTDVREGEVVLTDLWFDLCARKIAKAAGVALNDAHKERARRECPPPKHLDFRMH